MPRHPDNLRAARPSGAGYHALAVFALGVALFATGCPADYPSCETDKDCHPKEFCVANKCQGSCVPSGGICTTTADCCTGLPCVIPTGSTTGVCNGSPLSDGRWQQCNHPRSRSRVLGRSQGMHCDVGQRGADLAHHRGNVLDDARET